MVLECVNFHFWPYCNFKCRYCFAKFENYGPTLVKKECLNLIKLLGESGAKKINFVGGEPTLSSFLGELIRFSKELSLTTSIISNGTGINKDFIKNYREYIDWIGLSIDSGFESTNKKLGRANGNLVHDIQKKAALVKNAGIKLKINSVISKLNYEEDLSWLIEKLEPERWKVFQILEIKNQHQQNLQELLISNSKFEIFVKKHKYLNPIVEDTNLMLDSYLMIDPLGRFYQNTENSYIFSAPILNVGLNEALREIYFDPMKFKRRGGMYAW